MTKEQRKELKDKLLTGLESDILRLEASIEQETKRRDEELDRKRGELDSLKLRHEAAKGLKD